MAKKKATPRTAASAMDLWRFRPVWTWPEETETNWEGITCVYTKKWLGRFDTINQVISYIKASDTDGLFYFATVADQGLLHAVEFFEGLVL